MSANVTTGQIIGLKFMIECEYGNMLFALRCESDSLASLVSKQAPAWRGGLGQRK